jgi:hypothetical protein
LTKDRLDPEPGRTSRACGIRLSQNKENNALHAFVNKNARIFALDSGERTAPRVLVSLPTETNFF